MSHAEDRMFSLIARRNPPPSPVVNYDFTPGRDLVVRGGKFVPVDEKLNRRQVAVKPSVEVLAPITPAAIVNVDEVPADQETLFSYSGPEWDDFGPPPVPVEEPKPTVEDLVRKTTVAPTSGRPALTVWQLPAPAPARKTRRDKKAEKFKKKAMSKKAALIARAKMLDDADLHGDIPKKVKISGIRTITSFFSRESKRWEQREEYEHCLVAKIEDAENQAEMVALERFVTELEYVHEERMKRAASKAAQKVM